MSKMQEIPESILEGLKCSDCDEYLSIMPIRIRPDNTSLCGRCYSEDETEITDHLYESIAKLFLFPCCWKNEGCREKFSTLKMEEHESVCLYRDIACPEKEKKCIWVGKYATLMEHYKETHPDLIVQHPCIWKPDISGDSNVTLLMPAEDILVFLINIKFTKKNNLLRYGVRLLGESKLFELFRYYLEITGKDGSFLRSEKLDLKMTYIDATLNMIQTFDSYKNLNFKLTIPTQKVNCKCCGSTVESYLNYEGKEDFHCKLCTSTLEKSPEIPTTENLPCPNFGCLYNTDNEFCLHKHLIWLCNANQSPCRDCNEFLSYVGVLNHYRTSDIHDIIELKIVNNVAVLTVDQYVCQQKNTTVYFTTAFEYFFRIEVHLRDENYLTISVVSNIPFNDLNKFKCSMIILSTKFRSSVSRFQIDFTDVSKQDMVKNLHRFDWFLTVYLPFTGITWNEFNFFEILIQKNN